MDIHAVFDHVVGGDPLALVFWMWLTGIGQIKGGIKLLGGHGRVGGIDDNKTAINSL